MQDSRAAWPAKVESKNIRKSGVGSVEDSFRMSFHGNMRLITTIVVKKRARHDGINSEGTNVSSQV